MNSDLREITYSDEKVKKGVKFVGNNISPRSNKLVDNKEKTR